jgi:hypothetical protein
VLRVRAIFLNVIEFFSSPASASRNRFSCVLGQTTAFGVEDADLNWMPRCRCWRGSREACLTLGVRVRTRRAAASALQMHALSPLTSRCWDWRNVRLRAGELFSLSGFFAMGGLAKRVSSRRGKGGYELAFARSSSPLALLSQRSCPPLSSSLLLLQRRTRIPFQDSRFFPLSYRGRAFAVL